MKTWKWLHAEQQSQSVSSAALLSWALIVAFALMCCLVQVSNWHAPAGDVPHGELVLPGASR